jgi:cell division protein FtsB
MHALVVRERNPMRRKLLVLFVAFASVFGVVACGGEEGVEVQEGPKEEAEEAKQELKEATEQLKEAKEEIKEVAPAVKEEAQQKKEEQK